MSWTLFRYVFKDLLKVFLLASGVIAGIMSFGGLFKSLTENGLDAGQVLTVVGYLMPAMTTYSYPIAALFATTVVYGRLAADNEVTAVRAAGISLGPFGLGLPALVLGTSVALLSLLALSWVVPVAALQVEKTVFSNLAQLVASRIEQQHQIKLAQGGGAVTIYARSAERARPGEAPAGEQMVTLDGVSIVTFADPPAGIARDKRAQVPDEFFMAQKANVFISQKSDTDAVQMRAELYGGIKFPRDVASGTGEKVVASIQTQQFGPIPLPSPIKENTRFMNIATLQELHRHPERSRRIGELMDEYVRDEQMRVFLARLQERLTGAGRTYEFPAGADTYTLVCGNRPAFVSKDKLILDTTGDSRVKLVQSRPGSTPIEITAREAKLRVTPIGSDADAILDITVELLDPTVTIGETVSPRSANFDRRLTLPMPEELHTIARNASAQHYLDSTTALSPSQQQQLRRNLLKQQNSVISELHARSAFGVSCLVLVMIGYGLGVKFRSGNYLTAFAVCVAPALVSIVLIVTGQHVAENIPWDAGEGFKNPLNNGLILIWAGNAAVLAMAVVLLTRLRRT